MARSYWSPWIYFWPNGRNKHCINAWNWNNANDYIPQYIIKSQKILLQLVYPLHYVYSRKKKKKKNISTAETKRTGNNRRRRRQKSIAAGELQSIASLGDNVKRAAIRIWVFVRQPTRATMGEQINATVPANWYNDKSQKESFGFCESKCEWKKQNKNTRDVN